MQIKGKLIEWNDERGFGFIEAIADSKRFFVHISAFPKNRRPRLGDVMFFEVTQDGKGRANAANVQYSTIQKRTSTHITQSMFAPKSLLAMLHLLLIASLTTIGKLPLWWMIGVLLMSAATFSRYRHDKQAAQAGEWRTPENTLQMMSLFGGWSGALWAQLFLRHKSQKTDFLAVFWLTVLINLAVTLYVALNGLPIYS